MLELQKKYYNLFGTIRARTPEQTLDIIKPLLKLAGITRLANITGLDTIGIPVYTCVRPGSLNLATAQGKGLTHELAQCSAYMEGLEHYYAERPVVAKILRPIDAGNDFILHNSFMPGPFIIDLENEKIRWSAAINLLDKKQYYIPTAIIDLNFISSALEQSNISVGTTGLASGNTEVEACVHGIYECVERYSKRQFHKLSNAEKKLNSINLSTINNLEISELLAKLHRHNINVTIFSMTNKFIVPSYYCVIDDSNPHRKLPHFGGYGAHLNKGIALSRAITEAVQSRLTYISGSRDDIYPDHYEKKWGNLKLAGILDYTEQDDYISLDLEHHLSELLQRFSSLDYKKVLCVTHTVDNNPITVVHVVVPGLVI